MGEDSGAGDLPPGFLFFPSDEELLRHFLGRKVSMFPCLPDIIPTIDLSRFDPWDLHCKAFKGGNYWYFFSHNILDRVTANGYWKHVGVDEPVKELGMKKSLVFYAGDATEGRRTNWYMHEFRLLDSAAASSSINFGRKPSMKKAQLRPPDANKWVICRVYETSDAQASGHEEGMELSSLDEIFLSFDEYDEVTFPKL